MRKTTPMKCTEHMSCTFICRLRMPFTHNARHATSHRLLVSQYSNQIAIHRQKAAS